MTDDGNAEHEIDWEEVSFNNFVHVACDFTCTTTFSTSNGDVHVRVTQPAMTPAQSDCMQSFGRRNSEDFVVSGADIVLFIFKSALVLQRKRLQTRQSKD